MEEEITHLLNLFSEFSKLLASTNNEKIREVSTAISEVQKNPVALILILEVATRTTDPNILNVTSTQFSALTRRPGSISPEFISEITEKIIQVIRTDTNERNRNIYIDRSTALFSYHNMDMAPIIQLAEEFLGNSNTLAPAFRILSCIISEDVINSCQELCTNAFGLASEACVSDQENIRMEASAYIYAFADKALDYTEIDITEDLHTATHSIIARTSSMSVTEAQNFFAVFDNFIRSQKDFITEYLTDVFPIAFEIIANSEIDINIREIAITVATDGMKYFADDLVENLDEYVNAMMEFTLLLAEEKPDESDYKNTTLFFSTVASIVERREQSPNEYFGPLISTLVESEDIKGYLAAISLFSAITDASASEIDSLYPNIKDFIIAAVSADEQILTEAVLEFLLILSREVDTLAPSLQSDFEDILYQLASLDLALQCLTNIYQFGEFGPTNIEQAIAVILEQFEETDNPQHHEVLLELTTQIVLSTPELQDNIYPSVKSYLFALLEKGGTAAGNALLCFSAFSLSQPLALLEDIGEVFPVLSEALQSNEKEVIILAMAAASNLFVALPNTMESEAAVIFEHTMQIAEIYQNNEDGDVEVGGGEEEDEAELAMMDAEAFEEEYNRKTSLICRISGNALELATKIFMTYAASMADQAGPLTSRVLELLQQETDIFEFACRSSVNLCVGRTQLEMDTTDILKTILEVSESFLEVYRLTGVWETLTELVLESSPSVTASLLETFDGLFVEIFQGRKPGYNRDDIDEKVDLDIVKPILSCIEQIFVSLEREAEPLIERTVAAIVELMNDEMTDALARGYCACTLSLIASIFPENDDLAGCVIPVLQTNIQNSFAEIKSVTFIALSFLAMSGIDRVTSMSEDGQFIQQLMSVAMEVVRDNMSNINFSNNAALLWGVLVMQAGITPSMEDLSAVLKLIPEKPNTYILKYNAMFEIFSMANWPAVAQQEALRIAVNVFISSDAYFKMIRPEDAHPLAEVIAGAGEGQAELIAHNVEDHVNRMKRHVEMVLQQ